MVLFVIVGNSHNICDVYYYVGVENMTEIPTIAGQGIHRVLTLQTLRDVYGPLPASELGGEIVASPYDAFCVECTREHFQLAAGKGVQTDMFVWARGYPSDLRATQVGGKPAWPAKHPLPIVETPDFRFFMQVCFADSKDLVPPVPRELLSLWITEGFPDKEGSFGVFWLPMDSVWMPRNDIPECAATWTPSEPFHGIRYRTCDYPETWDRSLDVVEDEPYNVPIWSATKIGGIPLLPQSSPDELVAKDFLFQFASIQAAPDVQFPWTNVREPLAVDFSEHGIYNVTNQATIPDMSSVAFWLEPDGGLTCQAEGY
jgi:hypothetical protein